MVDPPSNGPQTIYYKAQFLVDPQANVTPIPPADEIIAPTFDGPTEAAAIALTERASKRSADDITFTRELIKQLNDNDSQNAALILNSMSRVQAVDKILAYNKIPSKIAGVIELEDGRRRQTIQQMNQVWDGKQWQLFNPRTADQAISQTFSFGMNQTSHCLT